MDGVFVFFQAEDGIRELVRSRGLGDVYKRQLHDLSPFYKDFRLQLMAFLFLLELTDCINYSRMNLSLIHI